MITLDCIGLFIRTRWKHYDFNTNHLFVTLKIRPQTYDGYSALHTQHSMYLNGGILIMECESWLSQDSPFKYMELSFESPGPKLMTDTQHSTLRIHTPHSGSPHSNT